MIHFAVAGAHFQEYWLYGVFMLVVAWLQLLWAIAAAARPSRLLWYGGAILNVGVVAVYIVTRTAGDVIGPGAGSAEPTGFGDVLCTVLEAVVIAGCTWLLAARTDHLVGRRHMVMAPLNKAAYRSTVLGGPVLDLTEPQSLVYANTPGGAVLAAAMYITSPEG